MTVGATSSRQIRQNRVGYVQSELSRVDDLSSGTVGIASSIVEVLFVSVCHRYCIQLNCACAGRVNIKILLVSRETARIEQSQPL